MNPFSAIITPQSVSFTTPEGKVHNIESSHKRWDEIIAAIKQLQASLKRQAVIDGQENPINHPDYVVNEHGRPEDCYASLADLVDEGAKIASAGAGRVTVEGGIVYYEGEAVRNPITTRIIWGLDEGFDMAPYMLFLDNSMENPSARAVDEMYSFMERNNMGITSDGHILGYKKVKEDFKDIYTGTMDNSPGQIVEMKRNKVDDDARRTCSKGLHFCSMSYLPSYGSGPGNKIVIVKVHPRDIVSVPVDYNHAKVRCCRYEVLSEYTGDDRDDLLGTKAVWSDNDFRDEDDWGDDETCDSCGEYVEDCVCDEESEEFSEFVNDLTDDGDVSVDDLLDELIDDDGDALGDENQAYNTEYLNDRPAETPFGVFEETLTHLSDILGPDPKSDLPSALQESLDALDSIDARAKAIYDAQLAAVDRARQKEIEEEHARLAAEARETALRDFHNELAKFARGSLKVWMDDAKKAPKLPTNDEVQKMLGSLAAELRQAEIDAGNPRNFDWETWLVERTTETVSEPTDEGLLSPETEARVSASFSELATKTKD